MEVAIIGNVITWQKRLSQYLYFFSFSLIPAWSLAFLQVEGVLVRGAQTLESYVCLKICHEFLFLLNFCYFAKFCSYITLCALCTKTKAACKPFDADKACTKAKMEVV